MNDCCKTYTVSDKDFQESMKARGMTLGIVYPLDTFPWKAVLMPISEIEELWDTPEEDEAWKDL